MQETYYKKLDELSEIIMGQSPPSSSYNKENIGLPFFQGKSDFTSSYANPSTWCTNPLKTTRKDDILISVRAPVGPTNLSPDNACIGRGLAAIRPNPKALDKFYLLHFLKKIEKNISALGTGSTFKAINKHQLSSIKIPLQSLPTQKTIADILTKAENALQKRREAIKLLDEYLKSVFLEMFGDPVRNEKRWEVKKIRDLIDIIVPTRDKPKQFTGNIPWITLPDVKDLYVSNSKNLLSHDNAIEVGNRLMPANTVLLSCAGSLGKVAIITKEMYANQQFYGLVCNQSKISPEFLAISLKMLGEKYYFRLAGISTIGFFSKEKALGIKILHPSIKEQQKFASIVKKVESLKRKMKESEKELDVLFKALMQRSFREG